MVSNEFLVGAALTVIFGLLGVVFASFKQKLDGLGEQVSKNTVDIALLKASDERRDT